MKPETVYFRPDQPESPRNILEMGREYFGHDEYDASDDSDLFAPGDLDGPELEDDLWRLT